MTLVIKNIRKRISQISIHMVLAIVAVLFLIPFWAAISGSLTDEQAFSLNGFTLLPSKFSIASYQYLIQEPSLLVNSFTVSAIVTLIGTALALLVMSMGAYVLSRRDFIWRKQISFFVYFTMLFNGGLIPTYILMTQGLKLKNNLLALIVPYLVIPWFLILLRTYFATIPHEMIEAAKIDGANEWQVYANIVMPVSKPALVTVGLLCVLTYWNDWWLGLLYIDVPKLYPLQYMLYMLQRQTDMLYTIARNTGQNIAILPTQTLRLAIVIISSIPLIVAFLVFQRYFERGLVVGSLKGD